MNEERPNPTVVTPQRVAGLAVFMAAVAVATAFVFPRLGPITTLVSALSLGLVLRAEEVAALVRRGDP